MVRAPAYRRDASAGVRGPHVGLGAGVHARHLPRVRADHTANPSGSPTCAGEQHDALEVRGRIQLEASPSPGLQPHEQPTLVEVVDRGGGHGASHFGLGGTLPNARQNGPYTVEVRPTAGRVGDRRFGQSSFRRRTSHGRSPVSRRRRRSGPGPGRTGRRTRRSAGRPRRRRRARRGRTSLRSGWRRTTDPP